MHLSRVLPVEHPRVLLVYLVVSCYYLVLGITLGVYLRVEELKCETRDVVAGAGCAVPVTGEVKNAEVAECGGRPVVDVMRI